MDLSPISEVVIGLGSNLGDRMEILRGSLDILRREAGEITAVSSVWETDPWGFEAETKFLNMAATIKTALKPLVLMQLFRSVEGRLGRRKVSNRRYESRIIDLDILQWGQTVISVPGLEIPHPKMADRRFVLVPMSEIVPSLVHPVTGLSVGEMLSMCGDESEVNLFGTID